MKRLGIFAMHDPDGIVDRYISYLLNDIVQVLDELVIVVNGYLRKDERDKLTKFAKKIYFREDQGRDAGAYKETILAFLGIDYIKKFDELLIFNDSFFGPFVPFQIIFDKMKDVETDFWGITKYKESLSVREHIQSYFILIRKNIILSDSFVVFWNEMSDLSTTWKTIENFEIKFTVFFSANGFKYTSYVKDEELYDNPTKSFSQFAHMPFTLLKKYNMPVLKRRVFDMSKSLDVSIGNELNKALKWIEKSGYDLELIWENVIRINDSSDLIQNLNLIYILPQTIALNEGVVSKEALLAISLNNEKTLNGVSRYIERIPSPIDWIVITANSEIYDAITSAYGEKHCKHLNPIEAAFSFIYVCRYAKRKYNYIGFIDDAYIEISNSTYADIMSLEELVFGNMLASSHYIQNVMKVLSGHRHLGLLTVPAPVHSGHIEKRFVEWDNIYQDVQDAISKLSLCCKADIKKPAGNYLMAFWCKKDILNIFTEIPYEKLPQLIRNPICLKYLIFYATQNAGFYTGIIESDEYASVDTMNKNLFINQAVKPLVNDAKIIDFAKKYPCVYIYGAGLIGMRVERLLERHGIMFKGFIVSDEEINKPQRTKGMIIPISQLQYNSSVGIIVAMSARFAEDVSTVLNKKNYQNVWYVYSELNDK